MFNLLGQPMRIFFKKGQNGEPDQFCIQAHGRIFYRDKLIVKTVCVWIKKETEQHPRAWVQTRGFLEGDTIVPYPTFGLSLFTRLTGFIRGMFNREVRSYARQAQ